MKKQLRIAITLLGLASFAQAQSFDLNLANKLQRQLDSIRAANNIKGISACVIYPGVGTWKGVTGISHAGTRITSDMEFGIASNTKLFTGVLLLKLAENKIIHLDDSLHEYLPVFNNIDPNITIRQLLNHTSGLYDVTSVPGYPDSMLRNPNRIFTARELMTWARPPLFPAGTGWDYCNTNYLLAGMVAESATGQSYGKLLRDSILTPLRLDSTFLDVYDNVLYPVAHPWQGGMDNFATPRKSINSAAWAAGAMYSTAGEMAQWYHALMNGNVINANSFKEMTTFVGSGNYGIGISRAIVNGRRLWQHGGTIWGGYNSFMLYDTEAGVVICVLINQLPGQAMQVATQLLSTLVNNPVSATEDDMAVAPFMVYPNPTSDVVNIDMPAQTLQGVKVFNATGQLLKETVETQFSVSNFPDGLYFITVHTQKGTYLCKLIKR